MFSVAKNGLFKNGGNHNFAYKEKNGFPFSVCMPLITSVF
jgi:hypothetical protein